MVRTRNNVAQGCRKIIDQDYYAIVATKKERKNQNAFSIGKPLVLNYPYS